MKKININGLAVYDTDNGKTPLVFVHAFPLNSRMWDYQTRIFTDKYRVITYDVRGLGNSDAVNNQFMMEHYADDFLSIIEHLKVEKINAVGLSMGGYILQRAILRQEDIFKTITFADTRLGRDTNEGLILRAGAISKIQKGQLQDFIDGFLPNLISQENFNNTEIVNKIRNMISESTNEGIAGAMLALATRTDNTGLFKECKIPALAIVGESDKLTPPDEAVRIKNEFPNCVLEIIKGCGHLSNIEQPDEFNLILNNFLSINNE